VVDLPHIPNDLSAVSCTINRARLQTLCSEIAAIRYVLKKGHLTLAQSDLLDELGQKCDDLWHAATVRLSHDELNTDDSHQELLIMDQCPIGRPLG